MPGEDEWAFHSRRVFSTAVELDIVTTPHGERWGEHLRDDHIWGGGGGGEGKRVRRGGGRRGGGRRWRDKIGEQEGMKQEGG